MVSIDITMCGSTVVSTDLHCSVSACLLVSLGTYPKLLMNRAFFLEKI